MTRPDKARAVSPPVSSPSALIGPRELSSWKQIAQYLDVNVRTAQKWERERGLPIRRRHGARGRVSTNAVAVDAWKKRAATSEENCYAWPLGPTLTVEVRFKGSGLEPGRIDLLRDYLKLVKAAWSGSKRR